VLSATALPVLGWTRISISLDAASARASPEQTDLRQTKHGTSLFAISIVVPFFNFTAHPTLMRDTYNDGKLYSKAIKRV
jgi:hypothetical protein